MSPRRQQTDLSDASHTSSADTQLDTSSMAVQAPGSPRHSTSRPSTPTPTTQRPATPRPATPGPMTRSGLQEALHSAPEGMTADSLRAVGESGQRDFDTLVSGMQTANDPDASSRPPSRSETNPDDTTHHPPHPKGARRLRSEVEEMGPSGESHSRRLKRPKHEEDIDRVDQCFPKNGQSSGTTNETDKAGEQDDRVQDEHDTQANGHLTDDTDEGSREQTPPTPSGSAVEDEDST